MQIECALHGGGVSRGTASVEEMMLGPGHEFMHEQEHEILRMASIIMLAMVLRGSVSRRSTGLCVGGGRLA